MKALLLIPLLPVLIVLCLFDLLAWNFDLPLADKLLDSVLK